MKPLSHYLGILALALALPATPTQNNVGATLNFAELQVVRAKLEIVTYNHVPDFWCWEGTVMDTDCAEDARKAYDEAMALSAQIALNSLNHSGRSIDALRREYRALQPNPSDEDVQRITNEALNHGLAANQARNWWAGATRIHAEDYKDDMANCCENY